MDREAAVALAYPATGSGTGCRTSWCGCGPSGGEHIYLPLNRALKPFGITARGCVRFNDYRAQAVVFRMDPHSFEGVWFDPVGAAPDLPRRRLLLYDDTPESRMDYFVRFERLMARVLRLSGATAG